MNSYDLSPDYFKIDEAARFLRVSKRTIYRRIWNNELPAVKFGGIYYIRKSDIEELLNPRLAEPKTEEKPHPLMKCAVCLKIIRAHSQLGGYCQHEGCKALVCSDCWDLQQYCNQHRISIEERWAQAEEAFTRGEFPVLVKSVTARTREINFLNRIKTRLDRIESLAHPLSGEAITVKDWDQICQESDQRGTIMQVLHKAVLDSSSLSQYPINPALHYDLPLAKGKTGKSFVLSIRLLSRLEAHLVEGFDAQPFGQAELLEIITEISQLLHEQDTFLILVLAATSGWDASARTLILGEAAGSAFIHPDMFLYLYDLEKNEMIFNTDDERLNLYAELFSPILPYELVKEAIIEIQNYMDAGLQESVSLAELQEKVSIPADVLVMALRKLGERAGYYYVETSDLGPAINKNYSSI